MSQGFCSPVINTVRVSVGVSVDAGSAGGAGDPTEPGISRRTSAAACEERAGRRTQGKREKMAARFMINSLSRAIQPLRFHRIDALIELSGRRRFDHSATQTNFALVQHGRLPRCDRPLRLAEDEFEVFTVD